MPETCLTFGKLGARVMVEGKEIQHYAIQVDPVKKEVSCWIASEAGKEFSVVWLDLDVDFPTSGRLYLDGRCSEGIQRVKVKGPIVFREVSISDSLAATYLFAPLVITDDDAFLENSCSIGEIKLIINRTTTPVLTKEKPVYNPPFEPKKVHERSKKAIAHRVDYGNKFTIPQRLWCNTKTVETLVTFIFKYRPLEMLQANGIAPRIPEPPEVEQGTLDAPSAPETSTEKRKHSEVKEEFGSEGESEDDEESKREKALLAELRKIREARRLKDGERPKKKVKKENKTLFIPGEVIDLT